MTARPHARCVRTTHTTEFTESIDTADEEKGSIMPLSDDEIRIHEEMRQRQEREHAEFMARREAEFQARLAEEQARRAAEQPRTGPTY
ncbi:hypothetical protein [Streptomyces sp. SAI-170]|uniref:hypothetical protein n=1 Tax=Streptomyces sp. SAI-170 TaxID=3377729 RepID=UPI003C7CB05D